MKRKLNLTSLMDKAGIEPLSVGVFLKNYLEKQELSASKAAAKMDCSQSTVSRLIKGDSDLTVDMAVRISKTFDIPVDALFNYDAHYKTWIAKKRLQAA